MTKDLSFGTLPEYRRSSLATRAKRMLKRDDELIAEIIDAFSSLSARHGHSKARKMMNDATKKPAGGQRGVRASRHSDKDDERISLMDIYAIDRPNAGSYELAMVVIQEERVPTHLRRAMQERLANKHKALLERREFKPAPGSLAASLIQNMIKR